MKTLLSTPRAGIVAIVVIALTEPELANAQQAPPSRDGIAQSIVDSQERFWRGIATSEPSSTVSTRGFFTYALALCEARRHPERLERLFRLAKSVQDVNPQSSTYGNFKWSWRDPGVTDGNSVEFCMHDALRIWLVHREWLPAPAREALLDAMRLGVDGSLLHRVTTSYTNIALFNAANLIGLGETLDRPDAAAEGYRRFDAFYLYTWQFGIHEFCTPTYYTCDLSGLYFIESSAKSQAAREQARALLTLFWTDLTLNWFAPSQKLGGAQSRSYNYLYGLGGVDTQFWLRGWLDGPLPETSHILTTMSALWSPPQSLWDAAARLPRVVRQRFGLRRDEARTHWMRPDIGLSTASAGYGSQDLPLTIDLPGPRTAARSFFIADGREDPYGRIKYETSSARHMKALHLTPFWAAAQRDGDALALAVYRAKDLTGAEVKNLQSHLVLRRDVDGGVWLDDAKLPLDGAGRRASRGSTPVEPGQSLFVRHGSAAVGVRVLWARRQDGAPATVALVDDGVKLGALRLTIEHRSERRSAEAGVALWLRAASGLADDAAFDAWRRRFAAARPTRVETSDGATRLAVPCDGPSGDASGGDVVSLAAEAPYGEGAVAIEPAPLKGILELDGQEIGRPMLAALEPARSVKISLDDPVVLPPGQNAAWEAEDGLVFPNMIAEQDADASQGRFVWQPPALAARGLKIGEVYWPLEVAAAGRYYLWARTIAPTPESDSFFVDIVDAGAKLAARAAWSVPHSEAWKWQAVRLDKSSGPTPLELPAGRCYLHFTMREAGTKLDALFLTPNAKERPPER